MILLLFSQQIRYELSNQLYTVFQGLFSSHSIVLLISYIWQVEKMVFGREKPSPIDIENAKQALDVIYRLLKCIELPYIYVSLDNSNKVYHMDVHFGPGARKSFT